MDDSFSARANSEEMAEGLERLEDRVKQDKKFLGQTDSRAKELKNSISQMKQKQKTEKWV